MERDFWQGVFSRKPQNIIYYISLSHKVILDLIQQILPHVRQISVVHSQNSLPVGKSGNIIRNFWKNNVRVVSIGEFYQRRHKQYVDEVFIILGLGRKLLEIEYLLDKPQGAWCIFPTPLNLREKYQDYSVEQLIGDVIYSRKFIFSDDLLTHGTKLREFVVYVSQRNWRKWEKTFPTATILGPHRKRGDKKILLFEGYEYMLGETPKTIMDTQQHDIVLLRGVAENFSSPYRISMVNVAGGQYIGQKFSEKFVERPMSTELSRAFLTLYIGNIGFLNQYMERKTIDEITTVNARINLLSLPLDYLLAEMPWYCHAFLALWLRKKLMVNFPAIVTVACLMNPHYLFARNQETDAMTAMKRESPLGTLLKVWEESWRHLSVHFNFLRIQRGYQENLRIWSQQNGINDKKMLNIYRDLFNLLNKVKLRDRDMMKLDDWLANVEFFFSSILPPLQWAGDDAYISTQDSRKKYFLPKPPVGLCSETPLVIVPIQMAPYQQILTAVRFRNEYVPRQDSLLDALLDPTSYFRNRIPIVLRSEQNIFPEYQKAPRYSLLPEQTVLRGPVSGEFLPISYYDISGIIKPVN